jgi:parallel beta-helix repeat protein
MLNVMTASSYKVPQNPLDMTFNFRFFKLSIIRLIFTFSICFMIFYILMVLPAEATSNGSTKIELEDKKIALVEPTFTYGAYQNSSFYNFYDLYSPKIQYDPNITVTTDLNLLQDRPIPHQPFYYFSDPTYTTIPYKEFFDLLQQNLYYDKKLSVTTLTDADVHEGKIFNEDKKNAYDVLILFHNEYATQSEYDNLKRFVINGGTILFTTSNELFAEVSYNKTSDSITLVDGHFWKFDGKNAKPSVGERWLKENKEWKGSNFLDVSTNKVLFRNNPFNYTHVEENYVTNPNAKILIDFQAFNITEPFSNATVAAYMLNYGNGKVINLGLWTHTLRENEEFLQYLDNVILPVALNEDFYSKTFDEAQNATVIEPIQTPLKDCTTYDKSTNVITVFCDTRLSEINLEINNKTVLDKTSPGVWILNAILYVAPSSTITIDKSDTLWLKILNKSDLTSNYIFIAGSAKIDGVKITSWDSASNRTIPQNVNGSIARPFIKADSVEGTINISNSEIAFLGNISYPDNGVAYVFGGNGSSIVNNTIHDMWDGFYSDSVENLTIQNNTLYNNFGNGINIDSGSHDINIVGNTAYNNSETGLLCSDTCNNTIFYNNTVHDNGWSGLMFSHGTYNNTATKNNAFNEEIGIHVDSSRNNKISDNLFKSNDRDIVIEGNSSGNQVHNNTLSGDYN